MILSRLQLMFLAIIVVLVGSSVESGRSKTLSISAGLQKQNGSLWKLELQLLRPMQIELLRPLQTELRRVELGLLVGLLADVGLATHESSSKVVAPSNSSSVVHPSVQGLSADSKLSKDVEPPNSSSVDPSVQDSLFSELSPLKSLLIFGFEVLEIPSVCFRGEMVYTQLRCWSNDRTDAPSKCFWDEWRSGCDEQRRGNVVSKAGSHTDPTTKVFFTMRWVGSFR